MADSGPDDPFTGDPFASDPFVGDLADVGRSGAREWERDMAAWETDAEMLRLRKRSLSAVLWEAMQRGDAVTVTVGGHTFSGPLVAARGDLAMITVGDSPVAVNVAAVDAVAMERTGSAGVTGDRTYGSFRAYLGMIEVEATVVRIVGTRIDVRGQIQIVGTDHVLVTSTPAAGSARTEWAIPVPSIGAVITTPL